MSSPGGGGGGGEGSPIAIDGGGDRAPATNPRRLPPPCWSHEETIALIDSYRDKWYSLRRGNLKANHWQEVAEEVGRRCPGASPPKTAVQCRHKMEKLRKRYRAEIQRARSLPIPIPFPNRFSSSWVHFKRMDSMEKGPTPHPHPRDDDVDDDVEDDVDHSFTPHPYYPPPPPPPPNHSLNYNNPSYNQPFPPPNSNGGVFYATPTTAIATPTPATARSVPHKLYNNSNTPPPLSGGGGGGGFRIRIPTGGGGVSIAQPAPSPPPAASHKLYGKVNLVGGATTRVAREEVGGKRRERNDPMEEMVGAIKLLGEGFVRMEQMKMEMAREMETMRMETEMKRTQMILDSQHRIIQAFAKAFSDHSRKRKKHQHQHPHQHQQDEEEEEEEEEEELPKRPE